MFNHLARICVISWLATWVHGNLNPSQNLQKRVPKQIHTKAAVVDTEVDREPAETHFGGEGAADHHGHGKYFMYQHNPHKDHYEFGYRRGNDHHFKERYEKVAPHHGHFKTKARWGDKHGGYGEHYWDYNHGDHHSHDEGSDDEGGDGTDPVPDYHLTGDEKDERVKREPQGRRPSASSDITDHHHHRGDQGSRRGSFSPLDHDSRRGYSSTLNDGSSRDSSSTSDLGSSRVPSSTSDHDSSEDSSSTSDHGDSGGSSTTWDHPGLSLAYDTESGTLVDEATGRRFMLTPIN